MTIQSPTDYTINVNGRLIDLSCPQVMGILNVTPDSFFAGSRKQTEHEIAERACRIAEEGGTMIDIGAFSTRPGADRVSEAEEMERLRRGLATVRRELPDAVLSVDTFRPDVARMVVEEYGVGIINDVSEGNVGGAFGGTDATMYERRRGGGSAAGAADCNSADAMDVVTDADVPEMFRMVARLGVPYILMSLKPTTGEMLRSFAGEVQQLRDLGVKDIILDPGFGFGKTLEQNYAVMARLDRLRCMELPVLAGVSRKSMIYRHIGGDASGALNGTTVLHTMALERGASILRVHDVREAVEAVAIVGAAREAEGLE